MNFLPFLKADTPVVAVPQKQSITVPPGGHVEVMIISNMRSGNPDSIKSSGGGLMYGNSNTDVHIPCLSTYGFRSGRVSFVNL